MGPLGFLLLLSGLGAIVLGAVGVVANLWMWHLPDAGISALMIAGGLASGAAATAILE